MLVEQLHVFGITGFVEVGLSHERDGHAHGGPDVFRHLRVLALGPAAALL